MVRVSTNPSPNPNANPNPDPDPNPNPNPRLHYRCFDEASRTEADSGAICTCGSQLEVSNGTGGCDERCAAGEVCRYMEGQG